MKVNNIYLSAPEVIFGDSPLSNNDILDRVYSNFKGEKSELRKIRSGIFLVL